MKNNRRARQRRIIEQIINNCGGQVELAERLSVSQATVSKWLNEKGRVPPHRAIALEQEFPDLVTREQLRPDLWG